jgi:hypothetical protein
MERPRSIVAHVLFVLLSAVAVISPKNVPINIIAIANVLSVVSLAQRTLTHWKVNENNSG